MGPAIGVSGGMYQVSASAPGVGIHGSNSKRQAGAGAGFGAGRKASTGGESSRSGRPSAVRKNKSGSYESARVQQALVPILRSLGMFSCLAPFACPS